MALLAAHNMFSQTHYYVNALVGSDLNDGTTVISAWKTIGKACQAVTPGSTVHILPGIYYENPEVTISGTQESPIRFLGEPGNSVIIDGTGSTENYLLQVLNSSYLHFENLVVQNLTGNGSIGILVQTTWERSATNISFKNCIVRNIRWSPDPTINPLPSENAHGFIVYGRTGGLTNLTIDGCEIYDNTTGYSEALTLAGNISGFSIKNCSIHDNSNIGIVISGHRGVSAITDEARNGIISNNMCYNNISQHATSAGIYVDGGNSVIIERNISHNNGYGIEVGAEGAGITYGVTVRNNILYNNQGGGLEIGGYNPLNTGEVRNCIIRNNSFSGNNTYNDGVGEFHITKASDCVFENNIFYTSNQQTLCSAANIEPQTGNTFNFNCWFTPNNNPNDIVVRWRGTNYTTFNDYRMALSQESNSEYIDPGFELASESPNCHLTSSSLCINSGDIATVVSEGEKDFDGNPRIFDTIIDKGAFEATASLSNHQPLLSHYSLTPNPATSTVYLRLKGKVDSGTFTIYDGLGHAVQTNHIRLPETTIDISSLSNGVYFTDLDSGSTHAREKLVIWR